MDRILPKHLRKHWEDPKGLIQVILGPRQVGKTTAIRGLLDPASSIYATADSPTPPTADFILEHWHKARRLRTARPVLVIDEVQKIPRWSEVVKMLWEEDRRNNLHLDVWLLGSSATLIDKGLSESLAGRFEVIRFPHWIFAECERAFEATIEDYTQFGGYPKAYSFRADRDRGFEYIQNSIVETTLGRDVLTLHAVEKPALLRQLFWYTSKLPAQIVSYEKILSHLQGTGNSATLVHYADLLRTAFILVPISKFSPALHRTKHSRPKWMLPNPALLDLGARREGLNGFVFENLVGSHLLNLIFGNQSYSLQYWREDQKEIDFVLCRDAEPLAAIEVKSGRPKAIPGSELRKRAGITAPLFVVQNDNIKTFMTTTSIEEVLLVIKESSSG